MREYARYRKPNAIRTVPNDLFCLKIFPLKYLRPVYIPSTDTKRTEMVISEKGMRLNILSPDCKPNGIKNIEIRIVKQRIRVEDSIRVIPTVLDLSCISKRFIIKGYL